MRSGTQSLEGADDGVVLLGLRRERRLEVVEWTIWEMGLVWRVGSLREAMNENENQNQNKGLCLVSLFFWLLMGFVLFKCM